MSKADDKATATANNSSDFVRKLYKLLEEPEYQSIIRWSNTGDSFVIFDGSKFTKEILPNYFKHGNFASFVRQLNKYDFHKVKQSNEENMPLPYGQEVWEFKHPEFQAHKKESMDNIKRKAPAPRKSAQTSDDSSMPTLIQQVELVTSQLTATQQELVATQHQVHMLNNSNRDFQVSHTALVQQVLQLQKFYKNHHAVMKNMLDFMQTVDKQRGQLGGQYSGVGQMQSVDPLQEASKLFEDFSAGGISDMDMNKMGHGQNFQMANGGGQDMLDGYHGFMSVNEVYPIGQTNGIDPIDSQHIQNIPYPLPPNAMIKEDTSVPTQAPEPTAIPSTRKRRDQDVESNWGNNKPRVLLVEDDPICATIGSKMVQAFECGIEIARDGLEAVSKMNNGRNRYDIIFMDIVMPNLDGVSATACIREIETEIPIIAMTSNIQADDIDMYFRFGMNDVLPKPFTKDGMLRAMEKHLPHFLKPKETQPSGQSQVPLAITLPGAQSLKGTASPGDSPATAASWHSPSQVTGPSPLGNAPTNYLQPGRDPGMYGMAPLQAQSGFAQPIMGNAPRGGPSHRRVISDMSPLDESPGNKRQRMYDGGYGAAS